jgi:hypothetical protein
MYWPWLSGLVVASLVDFVVPGVSNHFQFGALVFFAGALMAMWPWLRLNAPYSFWIFACLLWFCLPFVYALIAAIVYVIRG